MEIKTQRYIYISPDAESGMAQPGYGPPKKIRINTFLPFVK
jgi:hypothetical protein